MEVQRNMLHALMVVTKQRILRTYLLHGIMNKFLIKGELYG